MVGWCNGPGLTSSTGASYNLDDSRARAYLRLQSVRVRVVWTFLLSSFLSLIFFLSLSGDGRVVRWCWIYFQFRGVLLIWIRVGQGPTALAVDAGPGCLEIFSLVYHFCSFSLSLGDGPI